MVGWGLCPIPMVGVLLLFGVAMHSVTKWVAPIRLSESLISRLGRMLADKFDCLHLVKFRRPLPSMQPRTKVVLTVKFLLDPQQRNSEVNLHQMPLLN